MRCLVKRLVRGLPYMYKGSAAAAAATAEVGSVVEANEDEF